MTALLRTPVRRIFFALAVSALLHALVLWLPDITLPRFETPLPLLSAKLVPLPKLPAKPAYRKPKPAPPPSVPEQAAFPPQIPQSSVAAASSIPAEPVLAASAVAAEPAQAASAPAATVDYTLTSEHAPALPKHARLRFAAYLGTHGLYIGEIRHELEINNGRYSLHAELETAGLARLFKRYRNIQNSTGSVATPVGLQPDEFTESKTDGQETQRADARFDWNAHQINFSSGGKTSLPAGAQDILSFLYQLSQLPFNLDTIPLAISNGKKLEQYRLEVGAEEDIVTPLGKLHALHLRKQHGPNEEGLEVWLGMEYRLLPVKLRQIERNGDIGGEILIKEIRVADE